MRSRWWRSGLRLVAAAAVATTFVSSTANADASESAAAEPAASNAAAPAAVTGSVRQVVLGDRHACVVTDGRRVKCWGENDKGQLGDGTTVDRPRAVTVAGLTNVKTITAGSDFTCAVTLALEVKCWGSNAVFQLGSAAIGLSMSSTPVDVPEPVTGFSLNASAIDAGSDHVCVLRSGAAFCWGGNDKGQLGDNSRTGKPFPALAIASGVRTISAGGNSSCATVSGLGGLRFVRCWGDNGQGQVGDGTLGTDRLRPVVVVGAIPVTTVTAGGSTTCTVDTSGGAWCWGSNGRGALGAGLTTSQSSFPVAVANLSGVSRVSTGATHSCATAADGAYCWGDNIVGQVGRSTGVSYSTPIQANGLATGVLAADAGYFSSCARMASGYVRCFGQNNLGQLGDLTTRDRSTPSFVIGVGPTNASLVWYRPSDGAGYLSTLRAGQYAGKGAATFSAGWTGIAVSRDTGIFYNASTGTMATGVFLDGVFQQRQTQVAGTGWTNVAATCDSLVLYKQGGPLMRTYSLSGGFATPTGFPGTTGEFDQVVGSCDSALFLSSTTGTGQMGTLKGGVWTPTTLDGFAIWDRLTASSDTIFFMNNATKAQAWGTLKNGGFVQTPGGSATGTACADDRLAATTDSLMVVRACGGATATTYFAKFTGGVLTNNPTSAPSNPTFTLTAGGK